MARATVRWSGFRCSMRASLSKETHSIPSLISSGRALVVPRSALVVALLQHVTHDIADNFWQVLPQAIHLTLQDVEPLVVAVEAGLDRRQIVAVTTGLFENMPSDRFLALNLTLDHVDAGLKLIKLFPSYACRHFKQSPIHNLHRLFCLD